MRLITWSTGRRPITADLSLRSILLQHPEAREELTACCWAPPVPAKAAQANVRIVVVPPDKRNRGQVHNAGLRDFQERHGGQYPDYWFALDDDVVISQGMFERMEAVLNAEPEIFLLGAWNDGSERHRGNEATRWIADEWVQWGNDFNVGGAVQAIPRRALEMLGPYKEDTPWLEDHDITQRVRRHGKQAAIARTVHAVVLRDDGVDPGYRDEMNAGFLASRKRILGV